MVMLDNSTSPTCCFPIFPSQVLTPKDLPETLIDDEVFQYFLGPTTNQLEDSINHRRLEILTARQTDFYMELLQEDDHDDGGQTRDHKIKVR